MRVVPLERLKIRWVERVEPEKADLRRVSEFTAVRAGRP